MLWANVSAAILAEESSVFSAECLQLLEALLVVVHLLKDRHVVPGGEQLDILGHMAKREALIISASIIYTDVLQLLLIVGYFSMQHIYTID